MGKSAVSNRRPFALMNINCRFLLARSPHLRLTPDSMFLRLVLREKSILRNNRRTVLPLTSIPSALSSARSTASSCAFSAFRLWDRLRPHRAGALRCAQEWRSCFSSAMRPPPALHARVGSMSPPKSSILPLVTVWGSSPSKAATRAAPHSRLRLGRSCGARGLVVHVPARSEPDR
jgi:hypothetical protein